MYQGSSPTYITDYPLLTFTSSVERLSGLAKTVSIEQTGFFAMGHQTLGVAIEQYLPSWRAHYQ